MSSIVLDLQQEVLSEHCNALNALRKAHLIASKLHLFEFDSWINSELNGYTDYNKVPDYRNVSGSIKAWNPYHGWIAVVVQDGKLEETLCHRRLGDPIGDIIELDKKSENHFYIQFPADVSKSIDKMCTAPFPTNYSLQVSTHKLKSIVEQVVNCLLEWTIRLEAEGILGEGMQFNKDEKDSAQHLPQTINNYFGNTNVINSPVDHSAVIAGDENTVSFTYTAAEKAITDIESAVEHETLCAEDKEAVMEILAEIKDKVSQKKKPRVIRAALSGLVDFLIGVGANATVAIVQAKMSGLF